MKCDAVLDPAKIALLPGEDLSGTVCVVLDVLRATSCFVTALEGGAEGLVPVTSIEEALAYREAHPGVLLGGERHGDPIAGFDLGNSPLEYRDLRGKTVVSTSTNGTVALRACAGAGRVLAAALLDLDAAAEAVCRMGAERVLLVCAGTYAEVALEDAYAAGAMLARWPGAELGDAAQLAAAVYARFGEDAAAVLRASRNGRKLLAAGRESDVEWSARVSSMDAVGEMAGGRVVRLGPV